MSIELSDINYIAVLVSIVANSAMGAIWYSPALFANVWMKEIGATKEGIQERGGQARSFTIAILGAIVAVFVLAVLIQTAGADDVLDGLVLGLIVGVGFILTNIGVMYARGQVAEIVCYQCGL
jgi:hypothetical protein